MNTEISTRSHAIFSPSRLAYLAKCPWWLGDGAPGQAAQRGTELGQQVAEAALLGVEPDSEEAQWAVSAIGDVGDGIMAQYSGFSWRAETWVDTQIPEVSGYVDIEGGNGWGNAVLIEIKTGRGDRPIPPENPQVAAYALGLFMADPAMEHLDAYLVEIDRRAVFFHPYTREDVPRLRDDIFHLLRRAQTSVKEDLFPGPHCAYCALRTRCEAVAARGDELKIPIAVPTPEAITAWATTLAPAELSTRLDYVLPRADLVEILAGSLKARAMAILEAGGEVPGWTVKRTQGPRVWTDEAAAIEMLESAGVAIERRPPTPATAEKLLKAAGADKTLVSTLAAPGAPRLSLRAMKNKTLTLDEAAE